MTIDCKECWPGYVGTQLAHSSRVGCTLHACIHVCTHARTHTQLPCVRWWGICTHVCLNSEQMTNFDILVYFVSSEWLSPFEEWRWKSYFLEFIFLTLQEHLSVQLRFMDQICIMEVIICRDQWNSGIMSLCGTPGGLLIYCPHLNVPAGDSN